MAENTKIQWATHTFNPWRGCTKIAAGCANCYADAQSKRNPGTLGIWGPNGTRVVASEAMWREPVKWNRDAAALTGRVDGAAAPPAAKRGIGRSQTGSVQRPRVFCASLADVFEDYPGQLVNSKGELLWYGECGGIEAAKNSYRAAFGLDDVRARLFRVIDETPHLDWLLLTKRPENVRKMWPEFELGRWDATGRELPHNHRRPNVWLGTSIACQEDAGRNAIHLRNCRDLCAKTFLSIEPLVGPVDLRRVYVGDQTQMNVDVLSWVDWVIVGGESGANARPCDIAWIRSIVRQCRDAGVPVFVKQWGSNPHYTNHQGDSHSCGPIRDPKGGDPAEWPEDVRVREVPS